LIHHVPLTEMLRLLQVLPASSPSSVFTGKSSHFSHYHEINGASISMLSASAISTRLK
jgi:hypothetical protein